MKIKNSDPGAPDGSPIPLKIQWANNPVIPVPVTPRPPWDSPDGTRFGKDEIPPQNNQSTFNGRPCPPEFAEALKSLRERGLLDSPELKTAFIAAAEEIRAEQDHEAIFRADRTVQIPPPGRENETEWFANE
jgi:hypothetical protein